ncbi:MAG: CBS domain-containing protein [Gammaproteobacteria bacterium]|nr:CBS domain-containing protein [Gammaproteobacteria bacterium]
MLTGEYCKREVTIIGRGDSITKAAKLMREHHVGDVLVVDCKNGERTPVGILTDRDIVIKVLAEDLDLHLITSEDIMSFKLVTVKEDDDLMATIKRMRLYGIRRMPVVNSRGGLVGVLAVDDILDIITEQLIDIDQLIANEQNKEKKLRPLTSGI